MGYTVAISLSKKGRRLRYVDLELGWWLGDLSVMPEWPPGIDPSVFLPQSTSGDLEDVLQGEREPAALLEAIQIAEALVEKRTLPLGDFADLDELSAAFAPVLSACEEAHRARLPVYWLAIT